MVRKLIKIYPRTLFGIQTLTSSQLQLRQTTITAPEIGQPPLIEKPFMVSKYVVLGKIRCRDKSSSKSSSKKMQKLIKKPQRSTKFEISLQRGNTSDRNLFHTWFKPSCILHAYQKYCFCCKIHLQE